MGRNYNFGPSTKDGELLYTSVSALSKADPNQDGGCLLKWFFEKILKKRPPQGPGAAAGAKSHNRVDHYLSTGEDVLTPTERGIKHFMPKPKDDRYLIEKEISKDYPISLDGVPLVGYVDNLNLSGQYVTPMGVLLDDAVNAEVVDWKFTKSMIYAGPPTTLQMNGYGLAVARALDLPAVRLSLVWALKGAKPEGRKRTLVKQTDELERIWESYVPVVRSMRDVAKETDPAKVPANTKSCKSFGGCGHRDYCPAVQTTPEKSLIEMFGERGAMSLIFPEDKKPEATIALPERFKEAVEAIEAIDRGFPALEGEPAFFMAALKGKDPAGDPTAANWGGNGRYGARTLVSVKDLVNAAQELADAGLCVFPPAAEPVEEKSIAPATVGIVPPDTPPSTPPPADTAPEPQVTSVKDLPSAIVEVTTAPKAKPIDKMTKKELFVECQRLEALVNESLTVTVAVDHRFTLCADTLPSCEFESLDPWIDAVCSQLAKHYGAKNIRDNTSDSLNFGAWKGKLAAFASACFDEKPLTGCYYVEAKGRELASEVVEALRMKGAFYRGR